MGKGYKYRCRECGYELSLSVGIGALFPMEYKETLEKAKAGEFGDELADFLNEHPDAAINIELAAMKCSSCGDYYSEPKLDVYLPKSKGIAMDYVTPMDLKESYTKVKPYVHHCRKCGRKLRRIGEGTLGRFGVMKCPKCGSILDLEGCLLWD